MVSPEQIAWTRDVLDRVYDVAYLQRYLDSAHPNIAIRDAKELQSYLLALIQQLKPTTDVSPSSLAWRMYNALDQRYVRGLTQTEAAAELNVSLRQLRREQDRGIEAVATLLFSSGCHSNISDISPNHSGDQPTLKPNPAEKNEFLRFDDLIHAVLGLIDPLLSQKNVDVRVTLPVQAPVLWANRTLIRQLLIMVISFTIRSTTNGILTISSELVDDQLELVFSHDGPAAVSTDVSVENLGAMQQLAAESGVTFTMLTEGQAAKQIHLSIPVSVQQRIMMIDDSADAIELTRRYLLRTQFDLVAISRAEDALMQAQTLQPSCILLDVMMPGRDGWEILALLKSHPATIHIPVIVCSVLRNQDLAYALGATAVLSRPHTAMQLIELLQTVTAQPRPRPAVQSS